MKRRRTIVGVAAVSFLAGTAFLASTVASAGGSDDVKTARAATARFHSFTQSEQADYGVLADAAGITCIDDDMGAMGTHVVNGPRVSDSVLDVTKPELLLYDRSSGKDELMGAEYVIFASQWSSADPPRLFGQNFKLITKPNRFGLDPFWELHAWLWRDNPDGMFKDMNPNVHC